MKPFSLISSVSKRIVFLTFLSSCVFQYAFSQSFKGKDGSLALTTAGNYILNRYSTLASSVTTGNLSLDVSDINQLKGSYTFTNSYNPYATDALGQGDMIMIIQVQGADVATADNSGYGAITSYNNTGNYELKTVYQVSGNTIYFCEGLQHDYAQTGRKRTQVIRIPRLSSLIVGSGVVLTGSAWNGTTGGVVALDLSGNMTVTGEISASSIGFRGGVDDNTISINSSIYTNTVYVSLFSLKNDATKGESIAGNSTDYEAMTGSSGRGAVANGGGGGNGHNSGGGGGSNAGTNGSLTPWNGTGLKDISTPSWATAWDLEYAGFSTDVSTGGGRGGYSFSQSDQDALTYGPGNSVWGGNHRNNVGGFGGRPLDYNGNTKLFFGGGGGAGEGNNSSSGDGGNGGGIVYILSNGNISGAGYIKANGQNGYATKNSFIDAAGGAGGGGAVVVNAKGTITGITIQANGGNGGDQNYLTGEAEGPGGGGGGGYIATTATAVTKQVNGGNNGLSYSTHVSEFLPNGATKGASGTSASITFTDVFSCNELGFLLPVSVYYFNASLSGTMAKLNWKTENEVSMDHYELEKSVSADRGFQPVKDIPAVNQTSSEYSVYDDNAGVSSEKVYYRLRMVGKDGSFSYSRVVFIHLTKPVTVDIHPTLLSPGQSIILTISGNSGSLSRVSLFNMNGQEVRKPVSAGNGITQLSTSDLQKGMYILKVTGEQAVQSFKILLQ